MKKNKLLFTVILLFGAVCTKYLSDLFLSEGLSPFLQILVIFSVFALGVYILNQTAKIIEETTEVLSEKTGVAGGVLQSFGTAFPDMVLGIVAAVISLKLRNTDYVAAINYAIIAAATTFGANIYNVAFSAWCVYRQNLANRLDKNMFIIPFVKTFAIPLRLQTRKPSHKEMDTSISTVTALSVLTSLVAVAMVLFGKINHVPGEISGDLYQLIQPVGFIVFISAAALIFLFRKSEKIVEIPDVKKSETYFRTHPGFFIWIALIISGTAILFAAESMIHGLKIFSDITHIPVVVTGVISGIIGSLGEMLVVYNYTINPKGRIGDAIVGVAMDNIITIIGAAIVAIMGGIFLGGNALILIFVITLCLNTLLVWQISKLKDRLS